MKQFLSILLCFALIATGADIDVYQSNGTKAKKTMSGGATISTGGVVTLSGAGTVTSVAATVPSFMSISGSPVTTTGTLAFSLSGTALPVANGGTGITSLGSGVATFWGTPSSANLAAALTDETGSGAAVFANAPTFAGATVNGVLGGTWQTWTKTTGTVTVASTVYVDITGLSATIGANETWIYHVICPIQGATNGCKFQVTGPASPTNVLINLGGQTTSLATSLIEPVTAFSTPESNAVFTSAAFAGREEIWMMIENGANAGTIQVQFATASGTNTVTAGTNRWISGERKN